MKTLNSILVATLISLFAFGAFAAPVNINTADVSTLTDNIVGVGPKLADRIVKYRTEKGAFKSLEDLANVKGIGPKLVEKNKENIRLEPVEKSSK